jgi:hypothetical protein
MPPEELELVSEDRYGLDFGDFFQDPGLVWQALWMLATQLSPAICYCLEFHRADGSRSWFKPYGSAAGLNGLITQDDIQLPEKVWYDRLVLATGRHPIDPDIWPIVARWNGPEGEASQLPPPIADAAWHGQIRLEANRDFVGYFKAAWPSQTSCPVDINERLCDAHAHVQRWLQRVLVSWQNAETTFSAGKRRELQRLHLAIGQHICEERPRAALQLLCTYLTCHLGAGVNRVVCLAPDEGDRLSTVYCHGGNCSDEHSARIQRPLTERAHSILELIECVGTPTAPVDDPLYRDLAAQRPTFGLDWRSSASLVAELWRRGGDLAWITSDQAIPFEHEHEVHPPDGLAIMDFRRRNLAAKLTKADPLLRDLEKVQPDSSLLASRTNEWYAMPWRWEEKPLAIMIVDQAYWRHVHPPAIVRNLLAAEAILRDFAIHFRGPSSWSGLHSAEP